MLVGDKNISSGQVSMNHLDILIYFSKFIIYVMEVLQIEDFTFLEARYSIPLATWWANWVRSRDVSFWLEPAKKDINLKHGQLKKKFLV